MTRAPRLVLAPMRRAALILLTALLLPVGARSQPPEDGGLTIERLRLPRAPSVPAGDRVLTLVRIDLRRFRLVVLSSVRDGPPRTLERWVLDHHLAGGVNAGMFLADRRPVATLIDRGRVLSDRAPARFDGLVGWDPRGGAPAIATGGRGCPLGRSGLLARYASLVQGFRMMIDCRGRPRPWPTRRRYSAAALGRDAQGRAVFLHSRTPYRMEVLERMIVDLDLGIRGLVYMEGGPEASLIVRDGERRVTEIGSYEDGFMENDDNHRLWEIPSVIGFARR